VFLRGLYLAERGIAERLLALAKGSPSWPAIDVDKAIPWVEKKTGKTLAASQRAAIEMVLRSKAAVVTGGPGVGKTTLLDTILRILAAKGTKILLAAPLCTNLVVSGARWFKEKGVGGLTEAIEIVEACRRICDWSRAPWVIENPVSTLGSYWRKPDHSFDPHEFGGFAGGHRDDYLKRTCLWTGGGFRFPEKHEIPAFRPLYIRDLPPSEARASVRSVTPPRFARAVFEANVGRVLIAS
jgi:hypothetical protein